MLAEEYQIDWVRAIVALPLLDQPSAGTHHLLRDKWGRHWDNAFCRGYGRSSFSDSGAWASIWVVHSLFSPVACGEEPPTSNPLHGPWTKHFYLCYPCFKRLLQGYAGPYLRITAFRKAIQRQGRTLRVPMIATFVEKIG